MKVVRGAVRRVLNDTDPFVSGFDLSDDCAMFDDVPRNVVRSVRRSESGTETTTPVAVEGPTDSEKAAGINPDDAAYYSDVVRCHFDDVYTFNYFQHCDATCGIHFNYIV